MKINVLSAVIGLIFAQAASAATFNVDLVTDFPDALPGNGICDVVLNGIQPNCSLRAAIMEANATPLTGDIINLAGGETYILTRQGIQEDQAAQGDLDILTPMTIQALFASEKAVIDANGIDRVFDIFSPNVFLAGLEITGGNPGSALGGGINIRSQANANVSLSILDIHGNTANSGAAIQNTGRAVLQFSSIRDNKTAVDMPTAIAINNTASGTIDIENSAIYNNSTNSGLPVTAPTIRNGEGRMTISNSTISGNTGDGVNYIGAINRYLVILGTTIVDNDGAGLVSLLTQGLTVYSSILSSNTGGNCDIPPNESYDLNWNIYSDDNCPMDGVTDNSLHSTAPYLSTLGFYGGPTPTHRPQTRSDAIDRTNSAICGFSEHDQRFLEREVAYGPSMNPNFCDTGAVELETDVIFFDQYETL